MKTNWSARIKNALLVFVTLSCCQVGKSTEYQWLGSSSSFYDVHNWYPNGTPSTFDSLVFGNWPSTSIDTGPGDFFSGITFTFNASSYVITGSSLGLTGGITNNSGVLQTINTDLLQLVDPYDGSRAVTYRFVTANGGHLLLGRQILCYAGDLYATGGGKLTLSGNNYIGSIHPITVSQGTVVLNSATAAAGIREGSGNVYVNGVITVGDGATGANNVELDFASEANGVDFTLRGGVVARAMNPVMVTNTGSTGTATLGFKGFASKLYTDFTLNRDTIFVSDSSIRNQRLLIGQITGPGAGATNDTIVVDSGSGNWLVIFPKDDGFNSLPNTFGGNLRVKSGNLEIGGLTYITNTAANENLALPSTASVTVDAGAILQFVWGSQTFDALNGAGTIQRNTGDNQDIKTLTIGANGGSGMFSGTITSLFNIVKAGSGTQIFSGTNIYTGGTTISNGTLQLGTGGATGSIVGNVTNNGTLIFNRSGDYTFPGIISGTGDVVNDGNILRFSAAQTYAGPTRINSGTLVLPTGSDFALSSNTVVTVAATARLDMSNHPQKFAGLAGAGQVYSFGGSAGNLTLDVPVGQSNTFSGTLGSVDPNFAFSKAGPGTQVLSGTSTYLGATAIQGGSLVVDGKLPIASAVTISAGAQLAGGGIVGAVSGAGLIAPGNGRILTASGLAPGAGLDFAFRLTQTGAPTYGNTNNNGNTVLHLTNATPVTAALSAANVITVDFSGANFVVGQTYLGGIFSDAALADSQLTNATFVFTGTNGAVIQYKGLVSQTNVAFATGTVPTGKIMSFQVVSYTPPTPPVITAPTFNNGQFNFGFTNTPSDSFSVWTTTNLATPLSNWLVLGTTTNLGNGNFQFTDPQAATNKQRFYRVTSP